jgi:hypothetical protein
MPGYLDHYGEGHEQRAKRTRYIVIALAAIILIGGGLYFGLRNYRQKARVDEFVGLLQKGDYAAAYRLWGCTESKPCPDYAFPKFMEDWGPQGKNAQIASYKISKSRACGSGVIVTVDFNGGQQERFWVEGEEMIIGFSPWQVCPPR